MDKRALRRHHIARLKARHKREHYWGDSNTTPQRVGKRLATPCVCSCMMCGHARTWFGVTLAERRSLLSYSEYRSLYV